MFCPQCGRQLPDDSVFCDACGARLDGQSGPGPVQAAPDQSFGQQQDFGQAESYAPAQKSGSKIPMIAGIAVLALALAGGAVFVIGKGKKDQETPSETVSEETDIQTGAEAAEEAAPVAEPEEEPSAELLAETEQEEEPAAEEALPDEGAEEPDEARAEQSEDPGVPETALGEDYAALAEKLSTDDYAKALDFDWFLDMVKSGGSGGGAVVADTSARTQITGEMQPLLNGGWKAFTFTEDGVYGSDVERYFNAEIDTVGGDFQITLNLKYLFDPYVGSSVEENGVLVYTGTFDAAAGTAECLAEDSRITFDGFYISNDGKREYATGTYEWISGERDRIALMRTLGN